MVNPDVSVAADLEIVSSNPFTRSVEWRVPEGSQNGPISTGSLPWGLFVADKPHYVELKPVEEDELEETRLKLEWTFNLETQEPVPEPEPEPEPERLLIPVKPEDIEEINLYVSVFPEGQGLLPKDHWDELPPPGPGEDYNSNRVLAAEWKPSDGDNWTWIGNGESLSVPRSDSSPVPQQFSLPEGLELTGGQTYHWAVEVTINGEKRAVAGQFDTTLGAAATPGSNAFSSVTVLTPGVEPGTFDFPQKTVDAMAAQLEKAGAAVMDYNPLSISNSDKWLPVTYNWNQKKWDYNNESPEPGQPLVLLADWMEGMDAGNFQNAGVAEAAADSLFASLADLDLDYGGRVGGSNGLYDSNGDLIRLHGAVFNAPLHFIGFGQGAVVNTEIIQRLGTYFPEAGGVKGSGERDLMMTTVDPFEYNPESAPQFNGTFSRMLDPEIVVWDNVTYADNYYQVQGKEGKESDKVLIGKALEKTEDKRDRADINYELGNWAGFDRTKGEDNTHRAAVAWYGGTANLNENKIPLVRDSEEPNPADRQFIFRRLGDLEDLNDPNKSWYVPGHTKSSFNHGDTEAPWEGIGTGWFYSVNGGGSKLRPYFVEGESKPKGKDELGNFEDYLKNNRRPVTYDNTYTGNNRMMLADYSVPTLFNGNFDVVTKSDFALANYLDTTNTIPGWSFHNGVQPNSDMPDTARNYTNDEVIVASAGGSIFSQPTTVPNEEFENGTLVKIHELAGETPSMQKHLEQLGNVEGGQNYREGDRALQLESAQSIVHSPFLIPAKDVLRFNLHVPEEQLDRGGTLTVSMQADVPGFQSYTPIGTVNLTKADNQNEFTVEDTRKINYGTEGFETFPVDVPEALKGTIAKLKFEVSDGTVYLDNIFFGESTRSWKPSMNRAEAEEYTGTSYFRGKVFYHGTDVTGSQSISTTGIDPELFDLYSTYGPAFYTTSLRESAEEYSNQLLNGRVLDVMLKAKQVATFPFGTTFGETASNYYRENELYDTYEEPTIAYTEFLKEQGVDGVAIMNLQYFLVYEPEQVVVVK